ncbi:hypothetical protein QWZ13_14005 [Reinekea marina]|nr:hypothetical protein [Reinekea marina]MDN3650030.1 hypothetical protein [Reinekea marina]
MHLTKSSISYRYAPPIVFLTASSRALTSVDLNARYEGFNLMYYQLRIFP